MNDSVNNDHEFIDDPIFKSLRAFAAGADEVPAMPTEIRQGFRAGIKIARKRRFAWRGALGAGLIIIAFPTLAAAKILPNPIQHFVESVNRVVESPVHKLIKLTTTNDVRVQNKAHKKKNKPTVNVEENLGNITSVIAPDETSSPDNNSGQEEILNSLGNAIASPNSDNSGTGKGNKKDDRKAEGKNSTGLLNPDQNVAGDGNNDLSTALPLQVNPDIPLQINPGNQENSSKKTPPSHDANGGVDKVAKDKPSKSGD